MEKNIKLIAHMKMDTLKTWSIFLLWYLTQKNLPDINLHLLFEKKDFAFPIPSYVHSHKIKVLYCEFNDDLDLLIKNTRNQFFNHSLILKSFVFPIDVLNQNIFDAFTNKTNYKNEYGYLVSDISSSFEDNNFITDIKKETITPFVSIKDGWGNFNMSTWINRTDNPLVYDFRNTRMNYKESKFSHGWSDAGKISNLFY